MGRGLLAATVLLLGVGCQSGSGEAPPDLALGPPMQKNKVDILFTISNVSDSPIVSELKARFPYLVKIIDDFGKTSPASYHIGVVTADLGAGQFTLGGGQCHPGGDGAKLQAVGAAADVACNHPTGGVSFIDYDQLSGTNNLPNGQDLATTFGCMASVGDKG